MTTGLINHHLLGNSSQAVVAGCQCIGSFKLPVYLQSVLHQMKAVSMSLWATLAPDIVGQLASQRRGLFKHTKTWRETEWWKKTMKRVHCSCCLYFSCCILWCLLCFSCSWWRLLSLLTLFWFTCQPVSIRVTHSVIHIEQPAVEILENCAGERLPWLKAPLETVRCL